MGEQQTGTYLVLTELNFVPSFAPPFTHGYFLKEKLKHLLYLFAFCYLAVYILYRSKCQIERSMRVQVDAKALARFSSGNETEKLQFLTNGPKQPVLSIYRVPESIREINEGAYTPQLVSIGPYHHGKEGLKGMDDFKRRFLKGFLSRSQKTRENFIGFIMKREEILRNSYFEPIEMNSTELAEMVLEDAAFILELFYTAIFNNNYLGDPYMLARLPGTSYARDLIMDDLLKLENQLPAFILQELLDFANIRAPEYWKSFDNKTTIDANEKLSLAKLTYLFFWTRPALRVKLFTVPFNSTRFSHFLDFLRGFHLPRNATEETISRNITEIRVYKIPSVTELEEAGVKFKLEQNTSYMFDVKFNRKKGVLSMPYFGLISSTEILYRNMLLFEEFHYPDYQYVAHYMRFLNLIVNEPKDVEILVRSGIFENSLDDNKAAATLINNILRGQLYYSERFYFTGILKELISYYDNPWHGFVAKLRQDYFNTPWAAIAAVAAAVALTCTILQTLFAVLNHKRK